MRVRNIIFDMGGVILPMQNIEEPIRRFMKLGMTEQQCRELFGLYGQKGIFREVEAGTLSADEFLAAFAELTGNRGIRFEDITWGWRGFVQDPPEERLHDLDRLRTKYHLILLSNTNPFLHAWCGSPDFRADGRPVQDYFHQAFLSYELGGCKPDHDVFRRMLRQAGVEAAESVFLDDGMKNVEAAREVGIPSIHVPDNIPWMPLLEKHIAEREAML